MCTPAAVNYFGIARPGLEDSQVAGALRQGYYLLMPPIGLNPIRPSQTLIEQLLAVTQN